MTADRGRWISSRDDEAFVLAGTDRGDPTSIGLDETVNAYR